MSATTAVDVAKLDCADVCLSFGGIDALIDVSVELTAGSVTTAIIGANGAGKTSLLNCISSYYRPKSGSIPFRGEDITHWRPHTIAVHGIARTFQHSELQLGGDTVLSNIMLGQHRKTGDGPVAAALRLPNVGRSERKLREQARELADFLSPERFAGRPVSSPTATRRWSRLPGGPAVPLLDEPTVGMNDQEKVRVAELAVSIRDALKLTQMLIEHDVKFVRSTCDRAVALNFGRMLTTGTPTSVLQEPSVVAAYLGT